MYSDESVISTVAGHAFFMRNSHRTNTTHAEFRVSPPGFAPGVTDILPVRNHPPAPPPQSGPGNAVTKIRQRSLETTRLQLQNMLCRICADAWSGLPWARQHAKTPAGALPLHPENRTAVPAESQSEGQRSETAVPAVSEGQRTESQSTNRRMTQEQINSTHTTHESRRRCYCLQDR